MVKYCNNIKRIEYLTSTSGYHIIGLQEENKTESGTSEKGNEDSTTRSMKTIHRVKHVNKNNGKKYYRTWFYKFKVLITGLSIENILQATRRTESQDRPQELYRESQDKR